MMTINQYLDALRAVCMNPDAVDYMSHRFPTIERMENLYKMRNEFGFEDTGYAGLVEIYPLAEAKAALERPDFRVYNWHYDRVSGHLIINLNSGVHEHLSAALWLCSHPEEGTPYLSMKEVEQKAELSIEEGLGWFRSTTSYGRALKGKNVKLTAQEKAVFGEVFMEM